MTTINIVMKMTHNDGGKPVWQVTSYSKVQQYETEQAPNPVTQRVKIVMSAGLLLVHILSRWQESTQIPTSSSPDGTDFNASARVHSLFDEWFMIGSEQLVMMVLVLALAIKYIFFDSKEHQNFNHDDHDISSIDFRQTTGAAPDRHVSKPPLTSLPPPSSSQPSSPSRSIPSTDSRPRRRMSDPCTDNPKIYVSPDSEKPEKLSHPAIDGIKKYSAPSSPARKISATRVPSRKPFYIGEDTSSEASDDRDSEKELMDREVQTDESNIEEALAQFKIVKTEARSIEALVALLNTEMGPKELTDDEVLRLVETKRLQPYRLETALTDAQRGVHIRRLLLERKDPLGKYLANLPFKNYDYDMVLGACCENVVGYMPIPVGIAGPLLLDGEKIHVPMATTEGCLVASTNRGCRALTVGGGVRSSIVGNGMTRAPVVRFPNAMRAAEVLNWLDQPKNFQIIKESFDSTSRFARLIRIHTRIAARLLYIRLVAETGDAMGMNMLSKGAEISMNRLKEFFPDMELLGISGNVCTDKKPAAINWIEGRGKSVVCEATISAQVVEEVLKTDVNSLVELNISKNLIGSSMAGSIGGFNAHAANVVTALYIATGQVSIIGPYPDRY